MFKLKDIKLADPEEFDKKFIIGGMTSHDFLLMPENISPYEAYLTLKELLGPPNSKSFDDEKTQWQYLLKAPKAYISVYDWKFLNWSIAVYLESENRFTGEQIANEFLKTLSSKATRYKPKIKSIIKSPDMCVLQNPFILYYSTADKLLEIVEVSCDLTESFKNNQQRFFFMHKQSELCRSAFLMYLSSVEGFLNLLYELYLKKELREVRIYNRLTRDDRVHSQSVSLK